MHAVTAPSAPSCAGWTVRARSRKVRFIPAEFERAVLDHLYEGVYYVDRARRIRYWNAGAEGLTGYSAPAVAGQFCYQNLLNHVDASAATAAPADVRNRYRRPCATACRARPTSSCAIAKATGSRSGFARPPCGIARAR